MTLTRLISSAAVLLAILAVLGACTEQSSAQDVIRKMEATQRKIAALPVECTLGAAGPGPEGSWLSSTKAVPHPGPGIVNVFSFDKAVTARVLRVALDLPALKDIEKVETRDAQRNWNDAGPVPRYQAPDTCEYVWLQQELPQAQQVDALRFTFRQEPGTITVSNPGVLTTL